ncbi:MAG TPA: hypothetical protein VF077_08890 [Nitrospiraceae bacterium]
MPTASIKVRAIRSPILNEFRGFRVLAARPNQAGVNSFNGLPTTSYDKHWLIAMFGDYETLADVVLHMPRVLTTLARMGYESYNLERVDDGPTGDRS